MKQCAYCGRENRDDAVVCWECGTNEFKSTQPPVASAQARDRPTPPPLPPRLRPVALGQGLFVTLLRCGTLWEADLLKSRIEAAGIFAFIPDEFLMQVVCWNLNTFGFVRVEVTAKDYDLALDLLSSVSEQQ